MSAPNVPKQAPTFTGPPGARGIPAVLVNTGLGGRTGMIKSTQLAPQLRAMQAAGIRRVELTLSVEGSVVTVVATLVSRGARHPPYLHPIGDGGKYLAELYMKRRAASGRRHSSVPLLILSIMPLIEAPPRGG